MRCSTTSTSPTFHGSRTFCALIVMPRSRSMSMRSRYCARMARASTTPVSCSMRSASVDLPWSMWAMMQKFRIRAGGVNVLSANEGTRLPFPERDCPPSSHARRDGRSERTAPYDGSTIDVIRFPDQWIGHTIVGGADHMTQTEPVGTGDTGPTDSTGSTDWTGRTVRGRDGSRLGTLVEVLPGGARGRWGVVRSVFGRRRMVPLDGAADDGLGDVSIDTDRASLRTAPVLDGQTADPTATDELRRHYTGRGVLADARALQHERYGGAKLGSA